MKDSFLATKSVAEAAEDNNTIPGEMDAATKKVMIQKNFDSDAEQKKINLHAVSASCPVMNLQRNNYNSLYLKANQLTNHMQVNKHRIRQYLRENSNLQFRTLQ